MRHTSVTVILEKSLQWKEDDADTKRKTSAEKENNTAAASPRVTTSGQAWRRWRMPGWNPNFRRPRHSGEKALTWDCLNHRASSGPKCHHDAERGRKFPHALDRKRGEGHVAGSDPFSPAAQLAQARAPLARRGPAPPLPARPLPPQRRPRPLHNPPHREAAAAHPPLRLRGGCRWLACARALPRLSPLNWPNAA